MKKYTTKLFTILISTALLIGCSSNSNKSDDSDANNILPPTKDVSFRDKMESNFSLVIILVLVLIIGYFHKKDKLRKREV